MLWKGRRLITSFPQVEKINNKNMKNIHIEDDDINSLGLSNNICFSVFKEERRWVCKTTHLGRYAFWWEAEGFRARDGFSTLWKTNCLFGISVQLYLIGSLFLLNLFLSLFLFLLLNFSLWKNLSIFPEYRLQTIYEHFALITLSF